MAYYIPRNKGESDEEYRRRVYSVPQESVGHKIDSFSGEEFEEWVARLLYFNGYKNIHTTKVTGDFGVDITATKDDRLYAFQCKRYQKNVGVKAVQEVYAGAKKYRANVAVVVTNAYFTPAAREMAGTVGVVLWDRSTLQKMNKPPEWRRMTYTAPVSRPTNVQRPTSRRRPKKKNRGIAPLVIILSILYFPIGVILAIAKKYK